MFESHPGLAVGWVTTLKSNAAMVETFQLPAVSAAVSAVDHAGAEVTQTMGDCFWSQAIHPNE
jgi:hypothetical protein